MITLFYTHIITGYISLFLLLLRGLLSVKQIDWRAYKILKIAPHIVDTVLLATGISLLIIFGYTSAIMPTWMIAKLFFLVMYVFYGVKAFSKVRGFSLKHFVLAVVSFMMVMLVAVVK